MDYNDLEFQTNVYVTFEKNMERYYSRNFPSKTNFYLENSHSNKEGIIHRIFEALKRIVYAIINWIKKITQKILDYFTKGRAKRVRDDFNRFLNTNREIDGNNVVMIPDVEEFINKYVEINNEAKDLLDSMNKKNIYDYRDKAAKLRRKYSTYDFSKWDACGEDTPDGDYAQKVLVSERIAKFEQLKNIPTVVNYCLKTIKRNDELTREDLKDFKKDMKFFKQNTRYYVDSKGNDVSDIAAQILSDVRVVVESTAQSIHNASIELLKVLTRIMVGTMEDGVTVSRGMVTNLTSNTNTKYNDLSALYNIELSIPVDPNSWNTSYNESMESTYTRYVNILNE